MSLKCDQLCRSWLRITSRDFTSFFITLYRHLNLKTHKWLSRFHLWHFRNVFFFFTSSLHPRTKKFSFTETEERKWNWNSRKKQRARNVLARTSETWMRVEMFVFYFRRLRAKTNIGTSIKCVLFWKQHGEPAFSHAHKFPCWWVDCFLSLAVDNVIDGVTLAASNAWWGKNAKGVERKLNWIILWKWGKTRKIYTLWFLIKNWILI